MAVLTSAEILAFCQDAASQAEQLNCVVTQLLLQDQRDQDYSSRISLVYSAALVFLMQAGFAMLCAGAVRKKNVQNTMLKNLLDACGAAIAYFSFGYAFAFGDGSNPNGFIGTTNFFLMDFEKYSFWMFQYAFSAASATIVAGTLAERCQMAAYLCYSLLLAGFVYPVVSHSIWSSYGFLSSSITKVNPLFGSGMVDFAGGGVVHLTGGTTALFATMILGPRRGRFHDDEGRKLDKPKDFPGHSIALQMLGTIILWFGWYGFNAGSALITTSKERDQLLALCAVNTTLSGGMAGLVALFLNYFILERQTGEPIFDLVMAMNGSLGGLVAITAGCGVVEPWTAVIIGAVAGVLYLVGSHTLIKVRLDDAVDAIPVHMVNGMWGLLAVGLLASPSKLELAFGEEKPHVGWFYSWSRGSGDARLLACQIVGILWILGWVLGIMMPFFIWLDWKGWFRSDPLEEIVGLDTSYHGGLILMGGEESVNPEYISQFKKQRSNMRNRRTSRLNPHVQSSMDEEQCDDFGDGDALTEPDNLTGTNMSS
ncbi:ammonium transporter family-domain containing protein [Nitzschia inconspicua]|uniref:Ammonium transporter n=1 Tax=Nitzschia inconspicua TaxID=303405 RepID=A0A9K3Q235_9STRA|nr:ammonium transporter family-domain containing protein [Nitzschia inconspicua]